MKKQYIALVDVEQFISMLDSLKKLNFDAYLLVHKANIPEGITQCPDHSYVVTERLKDLFELIYQHLDTPQLIQFIQLTAKYNAQKCIELLDLKHCKTIQDSLDVLVENIYKVSLDSDFGLTTLLGKTYFYRKRDYSEKHWFIVSELYVIYVIIEYINFLLGRTWLPKHIHLMTDAVELCQQLLDNRGIQFSISRQFSAFEIPDAILQSQPVTVSLAYQAKVEPMPEKSMRFTLKHSLPSYFSEGRPTIEKAAEIVGLGSRTLKRRLHDEGTTYSQVLNECILELACSLLSNSDRDISDIALELGYPLSNHFTRAFKRMMGMTPKDYRNRNN